jgi:hypothetical protein
LAGICRIKTRVAKSISKACEAAGACLCGFVLAIARRRLGLKLAEKTLGGGGDFVYGLRESCLVGFLRIVEPADLAHELKGRIAHFTRRGGRVEVEEDFDIAAHGRSRLMIAEKQGIGNKE